MQAQAGCTEYNAVRRPSIASSIFGVSTFKGFVSIPCDGRGARRPLGQSFRESVGPPGSRWPAEAREGIARHNNRTLIEPSFPRFWIPRGSDAIDDPSPGKRGAVITSESPRPGHYGTLERLDDYSGAVSSTVSETRSKLMSPEP